MAILGDSQFERLAGLKEARKQLRELPEITRRAFGEASFATAKLIALRAAAKAPVRRKAWKAYPGGALREHIDVASNPRTGEARVGIRIGLLVARGFDTVGVTRLRYGQRSRLVERGPRKDRYVRYVKTGYKMLLRLEERAKLRAKGFGVVQPTKYGHFAEYGGGGRRGGARRQPFMEPAVRQSQDFFLERMRAAALSAESEIAAMGHQPTFINAPTRVISGGGNTL